MKLVKNFKKTCFSTGILILFFVFNNAFADEVVNRGLVPCGGEGQEACTIAHLFTLFYNIIEFLLSVIIPLVAVILIIYGAFCFITAADDENKIKQGKDVLKATAIGIIIVYSAKFIIESIIGILTGL